ncbi:hypothetical protein GCM10010348_22030 [Streptomyces anthocyanicus]|nr:hypothetical protein GCM10010348_22030 [Streptomyces anthocyanicus]
MPTEPGGAGRAGGGKVGPLRDMVCNPSPDVRPALLTGDDTGSGGRYAKASGALGPLRPAATSPLRVRCVR